MRTVDLKLDVDAHGQAKTASASGRVECTPARLWSVIENVDRYPGRVPMISRVRVTGSTAQVEVKFKVALFSVGFHFVVAIHSEREKCLDLRYVSGEPRGIRLRFDLEPLDEGRACQLRTSGEFDINSLGWLTKHFLKHHPEIQLGVLPGVAIGLFEAMRAAAEGLQK